MGMGTGVLTSDEDCNESTNSLENWTGVSLFDRML